jgi:phosphoribosylformylglycinamidine synthase II
LADRSTAVAASPGPPAAPAGLHRDLGLSDDELEAIVDRLGRPPTNPELAMFSVMWSEHCSYKSSKSDLATLPTTGPQVVVGPGEGAGVVELAPGLEVAWKIESHNHPSFVEPGNGAATGVGGIVRDVLSMGARPIALLDSLRFGELHSPRSRYLLDGVVSGISSYGNAIGVPTVGGEACFEDCYATNPLVNVACLGLVEHEKLRGIAPGPGNVVVLVGAATGRDGIGGASVLASAEVDASADGKRPAVQVGDPLAEKLLIEACLDLARRGLLVGLQDLGAGGISCPLSEMSAKAGTGMALDLDAIPLREHGMTPAEVLISESQERMMAVVEPERLAAALQVCGRWGVPARPVGRVLRSETLEVTRGDETVARVRAVDLADGPPLAREARRPAWIDEVQRADPGDRPPPDLTDAWLELLRSPSLASKRWIWEQYDHMMFLGTVVGPGADAAVVRLPAQEVAAALTVDGSGRLCYLDPYEGALQAVVEAARNVAVTGARPLAVTNCLNLGNPEKPEVMWQFREVVRGIGDACAALGTPVTGGNVSFYNETDGRSIFPTPVIGMLGVLDRAERAVAHAFGAAGDAIVLLGDSGAGGLAGSEYSKVLHGTIGGRLPRADLAGECRLLELLGDASSRDLLRSAHDVSGGGLAVCLAECSIAGGLGFSAAQTAVDHRVAFSESPGRAVVSCAPGSERELRAMARAVGVPARLLGAVGGDVCTLGGASITLDTARDAYEDALPRRLSATVS